MPKIRSVIRPFPQLGDNSPIRIKGQGRNKGRQGEVDSFTVEFSHERGREEQAVQNLNGGSPSPEFAGVLRDDSIEIFWIHMYQ